MNHEGPKDWEFFYGNWRVKHRRLKERLVGSDEWEEFGGRTSVEPLLGGFGNVDDNIIKFPSGDYRAVSLRSYDPETENWAIWWLDQRNPHAIGTPVIGSFADGIGTFFSEETFNDQTVKIRFLWTRIYSNVPMWEQAFSIDGGKSWETNWYMEFYRA